MRDKQWRQVVASRMEEFNIPQEKVDKFWSFLDYLESGTIKKHYERNQEEEAAFREANDYVNDMVYYLDDLDNEKLDEEIKSIESKQ